MKPKHSSLFRSTLAVITVSLASWAPPANAAPLYWDGTSTTADADGGAGTWATDATTNWDDAATAGNDAAWTPGADAVFGGLAGAVTVTGTVSTPSLTFSTTGYTVSGGTISLTGAPVIATGANNATVGSILAGSTGVSVTGSGVLTVSGVNTFTGVATISGGTFKAGSATALGAGGAGNGTNVQSGATLDINNQALTNTEIITIAGAGVGGNGAIINSNAAGQLDALNRLVLSANATLGGSGRFDLRPGTTPTLDLAGFTLTKVGTNQFSLVGTTVTGGSITIDGGLLSVETSSTLQGAGTVTINAGGKLGFYGTTGTNITRSIVSNGGAITNTTANAGVNSPISLASGTTTLGSANAQITTLSGIVSGTGAIAKTGTDTFFFAAANTYTGATAVNGGTLALTTTSASPSYTIASGAVLELQNQSMSVSTSISGAGTLRKTQTGTLQWGGTAGTFAFGSGGLIDVQAGTFIGGSNANENWTNNKSDLNVAAGALFNGVEANVRVNALRGAGSITSGYPGAGYVAFTLGVDNGSGVFTGSLGNANSAGSFVKEGTGTQVLAGANPYTGTTTINGGVLELAGSGSLALSPITAATGGAFRSTAPGKTLSALTANNGSTLSVPALTGGTTNVTGALTLGTGTVNIAPLIGNIAPGTYDLITAGSITGAGVPTLNLTSLGATRVTGSVGVVGNKLQLTITGTGSSLVWNNNAAAGVAAGTWDMALANFSNGVGSEAFQSFDSVTFDDSLLPGTAKTINLGATLAPALVTINNSNGNYTFGSTGALTGAGSLVKSGSGTATFATTAGYSLSGALTVNAGTLDLGGKTVFPSNVTLVSGALNNATVLPSSLNLQSGSSSATFSGAGTWSKTTAGTISLTGANSLSGAGTFSEGLINLSATATLGNGSLSLAPGTTLNIARAANSLSLANSLSGSGAINVTGTNTGTATNASEVFLHGNNTGFSGPITVTGARLQVPAATGSGSGPITITGAGGQVYLLNATYNNAVTLSGNGWTEGVGTLGAIRLENATLTNTITLAGNSRIAAYGSSGTLNGPIVESGGARNLEFGWGGNATTVTLGGASTYTGTTTLTLANLTLNGSLGATAVTVAAGSTIGGTGSIGSGGSLSFATGATNLAVNTAASLTVNGNVTLGGTTTVAITPSAGQPSGVIPVLKFTGALTGTTANLALANPGNYRSAIFAIDTLSVPKAITVNLGSKALTWTGTGGTTWNIATTTNWRDSVPTATAFYQTDEVLFDDSGTVANSTIAISGTLQPSRVIFNNTTGVPYSFTGAGANAITGGASLVKNGNGAVTFATPNAYTGATTVNAGTLTYAAGSTFANTATNTLTVNSGATFAINKADLFSSHLGLANFLIIVNGGTLSTTVHTPVGALTLNGGTLASTAGSSATYQSFALKGAVTVTGDATSTISGSGSNSGVHLGHAAVLGTSFTVADGVQPVDLSVSAALIDGTATNGSGPQASSLTKNGAGTMLLTGANTYTGVTTINAGTLEVGNGGTTGNIGTGAVVNNATLILNRDATTDLTVAGAISGTGPLIKRGTGNTVLAGTNTYTGSTTIENGTLTVAGPNFANASTLRIGATATLNLNYTGQPADTVFALFIDGVGQATGTWGAPGSGADHVSPRITGGGLLNVLSVGSDPYADWAPLRGLTAENKARNLDPDDDGLNNLGEFAFNSEPLSAASNAKMAIKMVEAAGLKYLTLTLAIRDNTEFDIAANGSLVSRVKDGLIYTIEGSANLSAFNLGIAEISPDLTSGLTASPGWSLRTFRTPGNTGNATKQFIRARVVDQP